VGNRLCASGLQAIGDAARAIRAGDGSLYIAGGVESMSRAPMVMSKATAAYDQRGSCSIRHWGGELPIRSSRRTDTISMGETAENVARQWNVSRADQDQFSYDSQAKYKAAHEAGKFNDER
jgi:acetyl-CoA acetyltransferase